MPTDTDEPKDYRPGSPPESVVEAINRASYDGFPPQTIELIYPAGAFQAAIAERDKLADVIDRAAEALAAVDHTWLSCELGRLGASSVEAFDVTHAAAGALVAMKEARSILAGAEPEDPGEGNG